MDPDHGVALSNSEIRRLKVVVDQRDLTEFCSRRDERQEKEGGADRPQNQPRRCPPVPNRSAGHARIMHYPPLGFRHRPRRMTQAAGRMVKG